MCLSNFKAIRQFKVPISWLRDFTRSYEMTSFRILRQGPGLWSPSPKGDFSTRPEAFRTGPPSCPVQGMMGLPQPGLWNLHLNSDVRSFLCLNQSRAGSQLRQTSIFAIKYSFVTDQIGVMLANHFRHKKPWCIRKLMAAFVSKTGVFSWISLSLDFSAKMAEFPIPVPQIWWSRKGVAIEIQLMNIYVSEYKYYCLHLVPKFGNVRDCRNWRLHLTARRDFKMGCCCDIDAWNGQKGYRGPVSLTVH